MKVFCCTTKVKLVDKIYHMHFIWTYIKKQKPTWLEVTSWRELKQIYDTVKSHLHFFLNLSKFTRFSTLSMKLIAYLLWQCDIIGQQIVRIESIWSLLGLSFPVCDSQYELMRLAWDQDCQFSISEGKILSYLR